MKARVYVYYRPSVFDPQGNTVAQSLRQAGFQEVSSARIGKVIDLELKQTGTSDARARVEAMCQKLLANPVIESYEIEIES